MVSEFHSPHICSHGENASDGPTGTCAGHVSLAPTPRMCSTSGQVSDIPCPCLAFVAPRLPHAVPLRGFTHLQDPSIICTRVCSQQSAEDVLDASLRACLPAFGVKSALLFEHVWMKQEERVNAAPRTWCGWRCLSGIVDVILVLTFRP